MDFALSADETAIFDLSCDFAAEQIAPFARDWETQGTIPRDLWSQAAALGMGGLFVPEDQGGSGLSRTMGVLVFEGLSRGCASVAAFLSIHNMVVATIARLGTDALREMHLAPAMAMEKLCSYCLTEPGSGSDAAALKSRAERTNEGWRLTGNKAFISGGGYSDLYLVFARTGENGPRGISAFMVEDGADGLSFGGLEDKMGWRSQPTRAVQMDGVAVPETALLGEEGAGFRIAMSALDGGRLNIAACSLGAAQAAFEATRAYMAEREAFGQRLDSFQALQFKLADCEIKLSTARTVLHQAAWATDTSQPDATTRAAIAKAYVTEAASEVADICLQLHGGYGYLADYGIEKVVRDLRVHRILEGTNEIMRLIIARSLAA